MQTNFAPQINLNSPNFTGANGFDNVDTDTIFNTDSPFNLRNADNTNPDCCPGNSDDDGNTNNPQEILQAILGFLMTMLGGLTELLGQLLGSLLGQGDGGAQPPGATEGPGPTQPPDNNPYLPNEPGTGDNNGSGTGNDNGGGGNFLGDLARQLVGILGQLVGILGNVLGQLFGGNQQQQQPLTGNQTGNQEPISSTQFV